MDQDVRREGGSGPRPVAARYFFALVPQGAAAKALGELARSLAATARGRAIRGPDVHLTLAFVGDWPVDRQPALLDCLRGPALPAAEPLELDFLGRFGKNLLWVGPAQAPGWMEALVAALRERLNAAQIPFDARAFRPHMTLVRGAADSRAVVPPQRPRPAGRDAPPGERASGDDGGRGESPPAGVPLADPVLVARWQVALGRSDGGGRGYQWLQPA